MLNSPVTLRKTGILIQAAISAFNFTIAIFCLQWNVCGNEGEYYMNILGTVS